jgi:hypothetical protein
LDADAAVRRLDANDLDPLAQLDAAAAQAACKPFEEGLRAHVAIDDGVHSAGEILRRERRLSLLQLRRV